MMIRKKEKGQNCSVPLFSTPQFSQNINAALFVPPLPAIKSYRKSAGQKSLVRQNVKSPPKENIANTQKEKPAPCLASC
jgi:hypothetical protein